MSCTLTPVTAARSSSPRSPTICPSPGAAQPRRSATSHPPQRFPKADSPFPSTDGWQNLLTDELTPTPAVLTGKASLLHTTAVPATVSRDAAVALLQDHEFFLRCDPHMTAFTPVDAAAEPDSKPVEPIPAARGAKALDGAVAKVYRVTDLVHALPAGIWDSNVVSTYEFIDTAAGVFIRIRSPLSVVMETLWEVRDADKPAEGDAAASGLLLAEDVEISCSRLLVGVVRSQCDANWKGIHEKMVKRLLGEDVEEKKV